MLPSCRYFSGKEWQKRIERLFKILEKIVKILKFNLMVFHTT